MEEYNKDFLQALEPYGAKVEYHEGMWTVIFGGEAITSYADLNEALFQGLKYLRENYTIETKTVILSKRDLF